MRDPTLALDTGAGTSRHFGDAVSIGVTLAAIADWLPAVAALLTILWTAIRIWETRTVQRAAGRWRGRRTS